ncbi:KilA-N domain-containing protein [Grimontia sp. NTOU-MAR1]|uniref:KilA-N domain-containing protein n=1 Tax=Grimontia sp. NTOU-MAR1 TaxID=3111011 RepID=UPI002DBFD705|nr:KilA-N domain-containing protein [Grimontia sp. NTOU-MAR1]WRV98877.1 KilA-N domain-containing protein [Grimontia sp. NTOU-MAR1]
MSVIHNSETTQVPVIAGVEITTDAYGRFNLNALHSAHLESVPDSHRNSKQPADWLKLEGTKELIGEISNSEDLHISPVESKAGRYGGTFAHELLAISYAGWISPRFQLQVNQAFLDSKKLPAHDFALPTTFKEALVQLLEKEEQREQLMLDNKKKDEEIHDLRNLFKKGMTLPALAKMLNGVNVMQINAYFHARGWLYHDGRSYRVASYARDRYFTEAINEVNLHGREPFVIHQVVLLRKGAEKVYDFYRQGELPMKKKWDGRFTHLKLDTFQGGPIDVV